MNRWLSLLPVIVPVLFWAWYHYHKDRHLPEPRLHLLAAFLLGVGAFWLGALLYEGLDLIGLRRDAFLLAETDRLALLRYAVFAIGPIEEFAKLVPFVLVCLRFREFDEPIDGIIYASFVALGFAAVENVRYLPFLDTGEAIARGFAAPVVHIVFASIWRHYVGLAWIRRKRVVVTAVAALSATALLHGLYDYLVIAMPYAALPVSALLVLVLWVWRAWLLHGLHRAATAGEPRP